MRNIFLTALLAACIFAGCTKSTDTNANHPDSNSSTPNQNTNANQNNSVRLDKFVPILQGQTGDTIYLTYNTDGLLDKAKNTKFTKNYIYSGGKLVRTESKSTLNGVEIKADENLIYNGNNLVKKELLGNTPESSYKLLSYDSILYDGNHIKTIYQITPRPRMNANGTMVTENEITGHTTLKWKNDNVDSLYTYDNNPSPRLAWVETYTYDDKPNYYKSGPDKALSLIYKDYYTMSANNIKTAKFTGYSASTVTVPVLINRSFTYEVDSKGLLTKSGVLIAQPQQQPSTITEYFYK